MDAKDAIAALAPLIGAGGITAIILGILGFLQGVRKGRPGEEPSKALQPLAALYVDQRAMEDFLRVMHRHTEAVEQQTRAMYVASDETRRHSGELADLKETLEDIRRFCARARDPPP